MSSSTTTPTDRVLTVTRVLDAPRALVYKAWTEKEHLDRWCAPNGFTIPFSDGDPRPGGTWHTCMLSPEGKQFRLGGVYQELIPNRKISFTHIWEEDYGPGPETRVTVMLADGGDGKTRMEFHHGVFATAESLEGHRGGWNECFDRLEGYLTDLKMREVVLSKRIDAPVENTFQAWTDPVLLAEWWGPHGFTNPLCQFEARPGGIIHIHMRSPDGTVYPMSGVVQEIDPPETLAFLSAALDSHEKPLFEVHNTITFESEEGGTRLHVHARLNGGVTPKTEPYLSGMQAGWAQSLERLSSFLKS